MIHLRDRRQFLASERMLPLLYSQRACHSLSEHMRKFEKTYVVAH